MVSSRYAVGIRQEATQGTPLVPAAATDYLLAADVEFELVKDDLERNIGSSSHDNYPTVIGKRSAKLSFKAELKGSGTRGDKTIAGYAALDAALAACPFVSTAVASTTITYALTSVAASASYYGPGRSVSIEFYKDGLKHIMAGCLGNVKINLSEPGKYGTLDFEFWGSYTAVTDAAVPSPTIVDVLPPIWASSTISVMGTANMVVQSFEFDLGNKVIMRTGAGSTNAVLGFQAVDREPKGSLKMESVLVATFDAFAKVVGSTEAQTSLVVGATSGNIITMTLPKMQITDVKYADREGLVDFAMTYRANRSSGDDAITIVVT
jgi:hypothetical protein